MDWFHRSGNVLARAQEKPEVLDWARSRLPDLEAITAAELSALAQAYLGREHASRVTILPAASKPAAPEANPRARSPALQAGATATPPWGALKFSR